MALTPEIVALCHRSLVKREPPPTTMLTGTRKCATCAIFSFPYDGSSDLADHFADIDARPYLVANLNSRTRFVTITTTISSPGDFPSLAPIPCSVNNWCSSRLVPARRCTRSCFALQKITGTRANLSCYFLQRCPSLPSLLHFRAWVDRGCCGRRCIVGFQNAGSSRPFRETSTGDQGMRRNNAQAMLFAALKGVARAMGIDLIAITAARNHLSFKPEAAEQFEAIYDRFATSAGASEAGEGFYKLRLSSPDESASGPHGRRTRRKRLRKAAVTASVEALCRLMLRA